MNQCQIKDDYNRQCTNLMSKHEEDQDGMCGRCASALFDWFNDMDTPIVFTENFK